MHRHGRLSKTHDVPDLQPGHLTDLNPGCPVSHRARILAPGARHGGDLAPPTPSAAGPEPSTLAPTTSTYDFDAPGGHAVLRPSSRSRLFSQQRRASRRSKGPRMTRHERKQILREMEIGALIDGARLAILREVPPRTSADGGEKSRRTTRFKVSQP